MTEIIGVRFKPGRKQYYFDPMGIQVEPGQGVILETARGLEYGECMKGNTMVEDESLVAPLRPVVRLATAEDTKSRDRNKEREEKAFQLCQHKIAEHKLDMKLVDVEYNFEGNKALFFFTSENRVDFRALVKDLASVLHIRIELRQIGVRDEAKMLGGLGICGKPFCCATFLEEFLPVSIKMAKTQSLSLNPTKISGTCGRLMCCLKYEQDAYEDAVRRCPKQESFVETPDGVGTVYSVNLLREQVKVRLEDSSEPAKCYRNCEICVVRNGKGKRPEDYVAPPAAELAKRRWVDTEKEAQEAAMREAQLREKTSLSAALEAVFQHGSTPIGETEKKTASEGSRNRGNRRRRPDGQQKPREGTQAPPPQQGKLPVPQERTRAEAEEPQVEGEKKPNRSRNRRRHRGGGSSPKPPIGE